MTWLNLVRGIENMELYDSKGFGKAIQKLIGDGFDLKFNKYVRSQ